MILVLLFLPDILVETNEIAISSHGENAVVQADVTIVIKEASVFLCEHHWCGVHFTQ